MIKKIIIVFVLIIFTFGCSKNIKSELVEIQEYPTIIFYDEETKEMYYDDVDNKVVIGKDGKLYQNEVITVNTPENDDDILLPGNKYEIGNYRLLIKNGKIGVEYNNNLIVNYSINYLKSGFESESDVQEISDAMVTKVNNKIILTNSSYFYDYENSDVKWSSARTYLIGSKGIEKTYNGYLAKYYNVNDNIKYLYNIDDDSVNVFNVNLEKIYSFKYLDINDVNPYACYDYSNENYCKFNDNYINLSNMKEIDEKTAYLTDIDDSYSYTLINNKLTIYKSNKIIGIYDNVDRYLSGYYFLKTNPDNEKSQLYELRIIE